MVSLFSFLDRQSKNIRITNTRDVHFTILPERPTQTDFVKHDNVVKSPTVRCDKFVINLFTSHIF